MKRILIAGVLTLVAFSTASCNEPTTKVRPLEAVQASTTPETYSETPIAPYSAVIPSWTMPTPPSQEQGSSGRIVCTDGTTSRATHRQGACSHHGGIG